MFYQSRKASECALKSEVVDLGNNNLVQFPRYQIKLILWFRGIREYFSSIMYLNILFHEASLKNT